MTSLPLSLHVQTGGKSLCTARGGVGPGRRFCPPSRSYPGCPGTPSCRSSPAAWVEGVPRGELSSGIDATNFWSLGCACAYAQESAHAHARIRVRVCAPAARRSCARLPGPRPAAWSRSRARSSPATCRQTNEPRHSLATSCLLLIRAPKLRIPKSAELKPGTRRHGFVRLHECHTKTGVVCVPVKPRRLLVAAGRAWGGNTPLGHDDLSTACDMTSFCATGFKGLRSCCGGTLTRPQRSHSVTHGQPMLFQS